MKHKTPPSKADRLILEEASEWFVDFRVGDVDAAARERFDEWLRRSPEHIRAYMEIAKTYVELPTLKIAGSLDLDALIAYARSGENVVRLDIADTVRRRVPHSVDEEISHRERKEKVAGRALRIRRRLLAVAAALALAIGAAALWQSARFPTYTTDIGERRSITLADGSTVNLNARSRLRIEFSRSERRVELIEGQALFQVSKDKNRPFVVSSGDARVRAVGTQFDVYRKATGTTVTVLEGRVAVYSSARVEPPAPAPAAVSPANSGPAHASGHSAATQQAQRPFSSGSAQQPPSNPSGFADPSGSAPVFLSAGEQVTVTADPVISPQRADIAATTAWMERRLIFDGSKLSDVVQEFNRYNRRQLIIEGAQLSDFHVSGVYSSSDPASLIRFLRDQPGIKVTENGNEVRIAAP
jgi:transmembrane sensor